MRWIKNRSGWLIFILLIFAPVVFWLLAQPLASRYFNWQTILTSLGQLAGLVGMAIFSLNLVLAARLKFLEKYFGGLNRVYIDHHVFGAVALILLLFHPLFLVVKFIPLSLRDAALFFVPFVDLNVTYGIFALLLMIVLLVITFYTAWRYEYWKFSHKFLGLAFFLASLHVFFIPSDVSRDLPLRVYMLGLATTGLASIVYRSLFPWILVKKYDYRVEAVRMLNPAVVEIELSGDDKNFHHQAGQFLFISFLQQGISTEYHPFTISSGEDNGKLKLTIKNLGDYTASLKDLRVGARAKIEGPFGRFSFLNVENKKQVWIAGGIGITPFLSMARSLKNHAGYEIHLFYCTKTRAEAVMMGELEAISSSGNQLKVISYCSEERGKIDAEIIDRLCGGLAGREIFVCGPPPMMKSLKQQFIKFKIPRARVHSEEFALL